MIRRKAPDRRLFYGSDELYRPARTNFYVRLNLAVGHWGEFCKPLESCFSDEKNGRPVDPVVYFKIFLIGYLENIIFDTDLAERIADSLAIREFLGYSPVERLPDHSSISRVRKDFAKNDCLDTMLDSMVARCIGAGLVEGANVATDSVLLAANASLSSMTCVKTGMTVREHLNQCRESGQKPKVSNAEFAPTGDKGARIATKAGTPVGMYYKATHVTDSKAQIILAASVSTADIGECEAARPALRKAQVRLKTSSLALGTVIADAGYDDCKFHAFVEDLGATPLTNYQDPNSPKNPGYTKADFSYDSQNDLYVCPMGKALLPVRPEGERFVYAAQERDCLNCPVHRLCLEDKKRRRLIKRPLEEGARERNIARCHTDEGREKLKLRKTVVEPPFGHMKRYGGMALISCWTAERASVKVKVAAIAWNLMKLAKKMAKELVDFDFRRQMARFQAFQDRLRPVCARQMLTAA